MNTDMQTPTKDEMLDMVNSAAAAEKRGDPLVAPPGYTLREGPDGRVSYTPTDVEEARASLASLGLVRLERVDAVTIVPHSYDPDAVKATVWTLEQLQMAGFKYTGQDDDGNINGTAKNSKFLAWAIEQQGYAREVVIEGDGNST